MKIIKKLLFLSLLFTFSLTASAQEEGLYRIYVNDFSLGMDSFDLPHALPANQGPLVKNAIISKKGRISKRKGVTLFAQDLSDAAWTGIGRFTPTAVNDYLMVASGPSVLRSTSIASWVTVTNSLITGNNTQFIQCDKFLCVLNGVNYPAWYDGVTFTIGEQGTASPPVVKYGAWFKNYLFLANESTEHDWVYFSNNLDPKVFTVTDVFRVNTGDGQAIQGLLPFKGNELIIYKERSVWDLDISGAIPLTNWSLQPILENFGCIAPRTIVNVNNDQWFLSSEPIGVRSLARTAYDKIHTSLVSAPIQDIFDGTGNIVINKTHISKAAAVDFDDKYLLAIPSDTSTVNDLVLVCDLITNGWYLITNWCVADWEVFDNNLYFIDSRDGRVFRAFYGNNDQASGPIVTNTDASGPTTRGVPFHYESKAYDFDSPELFKSLDALEVTCDSSGDYDLDVYIQCDNGGWQHIGSMNLAGESTNLPQVLPFTLSSEKLAKKLFHLQQYGKCKEMQVGFHQEASGETVEIRSYSIFGRKLKWIRE